MKKFLAISGGIDSMTLLNIVWMTACDPVSGYDYDLDLQDFEVMTVDHGTRPSSAADAAFVKREVEGRYEMKCHVIKLNLGEDISEAEAREARYKAMEKLGEKLTGGKLGQDFEIWTAQHLGDLIESIAINVLRGTGWRGLAALRRPGVRRPLLECDLLVPTAFPKEAIYAMADDRQIRWRLDPTNNENVYLRNRIRVKLWELPLVTKYALFETWREQSEVAKEIDETVEEILDSARNGEGKVELPREWFFKMNDKVADEILRAWLLENKISTTRPQRVDLLEAIRNYQAGKKFNLPGGRMLKVGEVLSL